MARINIRLATPADAYEIAVMSRCQIEVGLRGWAWHPARVTKAIRFRDSCVIVAELRSRLAGFAIMEFAETTAHLSLLAVKPSLQRGGIGRALMDWLEESALTAGIRTITMEMRSNNSGARCFYRMLGYNETEHVPGYYRGVETAVRMSRDIRRAVPNPIN